MSIRRTCAVFGVSRSYYAYVPKPRDDSEVIAVLAELAERKPTWGFSKLFRVLRRRGHLWNHKRVWRVYCLLKMNLKRKGKKRLLRSARETLSQPLAPNLCWSIDSMRDTLWSGKTFRTFNAVDDYNREALAVEVDTSLPAGRGGRVLDRIAEERGHYPEKLRMDNGPEFLGSTMAAWSKAYGVGVHPAGQADTELLRRALHRAYRTEVLNLFAVNSLDEVREATEEFAREYNEERPHESLGDVPPTEFVARGQGVPPAFRLPQNLHPRGSTPSWP